MAKEGARKAAKHVTLRGEALLPARCTVDLQLLEEEALAHMECQYVNGGMIMTSGVHSVAPTSPTTLVWPVTAKVPARWHSLWLKRNNIRVDGLSLKLPLHVLQAAHVSYACTNGMLPQSLIDIIDSATELRAEEQRISRWLNPGVLPANAATVGAADVAFATAFSIDTATGMAVVELKAACMARILEATLSLFHRLGPALRALAVNIVGAGDSAQSLRTSERAGQVLHDLQDVGVPIVSFSDGGVNGVGVASHRTIDCHIEGLRTNLHAVRNGSTIDKCAYPRERAIHFAAWLARHSAIGLRHMLRLMRPSQHMACPTDAVAKDALLHGAGTRSEVSLRSRRRTA